ncbi:hypothetical protein J4E08_06715 [Sagittula sp. NFXS13]|uniref:hypothetical protein n=1 Tax=Sagittula sp. NFXS13 TaxID=2819095 RepID=UPI0032DEFE57
MSRRDGRKALELHLPDDLRRRLVKTTQQHLPLAYLARQALRQAMDKGVQWQKEVRPGPARPILLQLSAEERARLDMWIARHDVLPEVAVLSLIGAVV